MLKTKEQFYKMRDKDMNCDKSTAELKAIYNVIDDARTEKDNPKVLEVACGSGAAMIRLINEFGLKDITGTDIDEVAVKVCKEKGLNVVQANIESLPFDNDSFDAIYGQFILEHIENPVIAIRECLRVAKRVVFVIGMGERLDADDTNEHELPFLRVMNKNITEDVLKEIFKDVPDERHKVIKDVVVYNYKGVTIKNYVIVIDRIKKKEEEVE